MSKPKIINKKNDTEYPSGLDCDTINAVSSLTKREKFALAAMQGIWSSSTADFAKALGVIKEENGVDPKDTIASMAVTQADALLKALEE